MHGGVIARGLAAGGRSKSARNSALQGNPVPAGPPFAKLCAAEGRTTLVTKGFTEG